MQIQSSRFKSLSLVLALALAISPEMLAQQASSQAQSTQQQPTPQQTGQPAPAPQTPPSGGAINPSQPPLQPVTTYPSASDTDQNQQSPTASQQDQNTANAPEAPQPKQQPSQPVGAATAEHVPTAGGAAAKPAGAAIAPAKQHQTRSLLIKIGAIAAAGAAVGTIYALSRGTSSTPPNAGAGIPK
ncbi:MAG TPA: hypothetical protein VJV96_11435 [Candidatus Angelobacter sp.]|jgi:cobalamin biosynthesis Mg chelatase CobN|nr:hypothetical protein [Candidatus Angelobacter sp.]